MEFTNILFPVDFSSRCEAEASHVRGIANMFDAAVTLLHVSEAPWPIQDGMGMPAVPEIQWQELLDDAALRLRQFESSHFQGLKVQSAVRQGDPPAEAVAWAVEKGADLIAIPTHGRGRFRSALLGSVAAKVLHDAHCAVWTSAHMEQPANPDWLGWRSILCAVDLTEQSAPLVHYAARLAAQCSATVYLVHAVPSQPTGPEGLMDDGFARFLKDSARQGLAALQTETNTNFEICLEAGTPSQVIAVAAVRHNSDLVLLGRGKMLQFAGPLRTHSYAIVRDAPCPVMSV
jgi:nucleotide-binding universal stress UspA family protein